MGKDFTTLSVERPSTLHRKNAVFEVECQTALAVRLHIGQHCHSLLSQRRFQILQLQLVSHWILLLQLVSHWILSPVNGRGLLPLCGTALSDLTTTMWDSTVRSDYHNVGQHCQILLPQCGTALSDLTTTMSDSTDRVYNRNVVFRFYCYS